VHIPDGWLSAPVFLTANALAAGALTWATIRARRELEESAIPLMGVMGAFVFAAQMINLPLPGGISGHLMGGVLLAIVLGPAVGALVIASVLLLQALLFADGGLLAFGANFLNMGLVGTLGGYFIYRGVRRFVSGTRGLYLGAALGAWLATVAGAALAALHIGLSGTAPLGAVTLAAVVFHMAIGAIEAAVTVAVLRHLVRARPELFALDSPAPEAASGSPAVAAPSAGRSAKVVPKVVPKVVH
jgi:cobalt/nickel transport system permease protein